MIATPCEGIQPIDFPTVTCCPFSVVSLYLLSLESVFSSLFGWMDAWWGNYRFFTFLAACFKVLYHGIVEEKDKNAFKKLELPPGGGALMWIF